MEKIEFVMNQLFFPWGALYIFVIGSCIGSFLNVCIWRLPRNESLTHPGSHCPTCNYKIRSWENIPILAWMFLRGKCSHCKNVISIKYPAIEALTGIFFILVAYRSQQMNYALIMLPGLFYLISAFIAIYFIDIKHFIIPNEITFTGIFLALSLAIIFPESQILPSYHELYLYREDFLILLRLLNEYGFDLTNSPRIASITYSLSGLLLGYGTLALFVELGKRLFGRQKFKSKTPLTVFLTNKGATEEGDEELKWDEMFNRDSDNFIILADSAEFTEITKDAEQEILLENCIIKINHKTAYINEKKILLNELKNIKISTREYSIPREAMGYGDVKMMAMIGAFLGPSACIFTIFLSSFAGSIIGSLFLITGLKKRGFQLPYGPYIAVAATIWMLWWPNILEGYLSCMSFLSNVIGPST